MITLRFGGYQPPRSVHTRGLHTLRDTAAQRSNGDMTIALEENIVAAGRKAGDLLRMVETGELDGCYFASSYLTAKIPALGVFDTPFQAGSREDTFSALHADTGAQLAEQMMAATPYRMLGFWDNGIRHISNAVRPIRTPADCAGLSLRTLDNALHQAAFAKLGFKPEFIDVAELPHAIAERRVDAQENPLTNLVNFGIQAHHKFVSLTGHLLGIALLLINRARFEALPKEMRGVLMDAVRDSEATQRTLAAAEDTACLRILIESGVAVIGPEEIDLPAFRSAVIGRG